MKFTKILVAFEVILILAASASLMFVSSCGTTQMVNLWKDPSYQATPLKKIMVIAMRKDQLSRRMWEDAFVSQLQKDRTQTVAVSSYHVFTDEVPDTMEIRDKTKEEGFDAVLVVSKVERDTVFTHMQGYITDEPYTDYSYWWGTYVTRYAVIYHPDYIEAQTQVSVRTDLLLVPENGRLVWSGTSEEIDPSSPDQFRKSVAELVIDNLMKVQFVR
jgi:hypothetical protein